MARCGFKTDIKYYDENTGKYIPYICPEPEENILDSGSCIFHDENYLTDLKNKEVNEQNLHRKFSEKLAKSERLICIGYHIPIISSGELYSDKSVNFSRAVFMGLTNFNRAQFTKQANFSEAKFTKQVNFYSAQFTEFAVFYRAKFNDEAYFSRAYVKEAVFTQAQFKEAKLYQTQFVEKADFSEIISTVEKAHPHLDFYNVQFDDPEHITFLKDNLSEVSFVNTDITRVRFGEDVVWGDKFKIREEREIENQLKTRNVARDIQLGDVLAVYRNLRENYEFRMRYDEAGEFFIREMEVKRHYRQEPKNGQSQIRRNNRVIRNLSLIGLYYHLSKYGQSFSRPTIFGIGIILFSTLLWLTQPNPAADFSIRDMTIPQIITIPEMDNKTNIEIALERGLTNFLPSLSFGTELNVGLLDVAFKIVGGAVTFGLIIIALRRKFERKFRH